jgi:hypothetical protein
MHVQKPDVRPDEYNESTGLTHGSVGLSNTTSNTSEHTRRGWADAKALDRVLFNFGRSENKDSSLGGCFNPCLYCQLGPRRQRRKLTQGIRPW